MLSGLLFEKPDAGFTQEQRHFDRLLWHGQLFWRRQEILDARQLANRHVEIMSAFAHSGASRFSSTLLRKSESDHLGR